MSRKGKTYEEIYGDRADEERKKRNEGKRIVKCFRTKWCECDCGGQFREGSRYPRRFIYGHSSRSNNGMRGKHHTEEAKQKNREAHLGKPAWNAGLTKETDERVAKYAKKLKDRQTQSSYMKELWSDPEYKAKRLEAICRGAKITPNKPEKLLDELLQKLFPNQWKFVGDGKFKKHIVGGKVPDFININGQRKIIEMNGDWWHSKKKTNRTKEEEEQQRIDSFAKEGYQTLIIWQHELSDMEKLLNKLREFLDKKEEK